MEKYKGFVLGFFDIPILRVYAYNNNISFSIGMTEIQKRAYEILYGCDFSQSILINSMKQLIDNYLLCKSY